MIKEIKGYYVLDDVLDEYAKRITTPEKLVYRTQDIMLRMLNIMLTQSEDVKCGIEWDMLMMKKEGRNETT